MYRDKEKQREANRLASRRKRDKAKGMTRQGMTEDKSVIPEGVAYPAIIVALADKDKGDKLIRICNQLRDRRLLDNVRYGINGYTFTEADKMISCLT